MTQYISVRGLKNNSASTWLKFSNKIVGKLYLSNIISFLDSFWSEKIECLSDDTIVLLIFKVGFSNKEYRSFSQLTQINKNFIYKVGFLNEVEFYYNNNYDNYISLSVESINIFYKILENPIDIQSSPLRAWI